MLSVIILGYIGLVVLAFKVVKIKVSPTSVGVFTFVGVVVSRRSVLAATWKFSAPMTGKMTVKRNVVPLLAAQDSKEFISKIHVPQNQMVKKGTPLYEYDPRPNQYALDQLTAQLAASQAKISELEAAVEVAAASVEAAQANQSYAEAVFETSKKVQELNPNAVAELQVTVQSAEVRVITGRRRPGDCGPTGGGVRLDQRQGSHQSDRGPNRYRKTQSGTERRQSACRRLHHELSSVSKARWGQP